MNKADIVLKIIVPTASLIVILLTIALIFIVKKQFKKNKIDKTLKKLFDQVSYDRLSKFNSEVSRIRVLAQSNQKYERIANNLVYLFDKLDDNYKIANQILSEINRTNNAFIEEINIAKNKYNISKKEFNFKVSEVEEQIRLIKDLETEFEVVASQITHQDEFLKSEFTLFQTNLRKAVEVYKTKRVLLDKVSKKIDEIISFIRNQEKEFTDTILTGNMKESSDILKNYSKLVIKFAEIINEGPTIQTYIFEVIPKTIKTIVENYQARQNELQGSNAIINFNESIKIAAKMFHEAKIEYEKLNIQKAKDLIRKVLKSIKATEKIINLEIRSRNTILSSYKEINAEVKESLTRYVSLREQFRILVGKGIQVPFELNDLFMQVKALSKEVDEKALALSGVISDKDIPFSSKLQRAKMLVQLTLEFTNKMNEIMQILWAINFESSLLRNKFKQAEAAVNEIMSNIKRQNILIASSEQKEFELLSERINVIAEKIQDDNASKTLAEDINLLVSNSVSFYKAIGSKIQLAEMVANVIREFSPRRALDEKINYSLMQAEKLYLEGKYAEALNIIVTELESGRK